ncbi:CAP-Gly domain-containing linker protein 1-like isoform X1, partial [Clarias magur]
PGSAAVFPIYAKLHQSVTLPCEAQCSPGKAKWSLTDNRDDVFARCDQTSCRSVQQGFNMSHDQYKRGDLSLTITNPDYSMRKTYTCECDYSDYATWRLKISTVFSAVQMRPGEDLKLDLSVPESVEVIYRGSDSADGVQICNVTHGTLQCNTEYTPRTSLSNSELTLRNMWRSENGTYTIRNLDHKEDIRVYAVSVSGLTTGEIAGTVIAVLLLLVLLIAGVVTYMRRKAAGEKEEAERKRREVKSQMKAVDELISQALLKSEGEVEDVLQQVEEKINALKQMYRWDKEYSEHVTSFCYSKREELELYRKLYEPELRALQPVTGEVKSNMVAVDELIKQAQLRPAGALMEALQQVEEKINALEQKYRDDNKYLDSVRLFCNSKRSYLKLYIEVFTTENRSLQSVIEEVRTEMEAVDELIKQIQLKPLEEQGKVIQQAFETINDLELKYSWTGEYYMNVMFFCGVKRTELEFYRKFYGTQNGFPDPQTKEVKREVEAVDDLIKQARHKAPGEQEKVLQKAEKKIHHLLENYPDFERLCLFKREEPYLCRKIYGTQKGSQHHGAGEVMNKVTAVYERIRQVKRKPPGKVEAAIQEVEEKINDLEQKCRHDRDYYTSVELFCNQKRRDLELCSKLDLIQLGFDWTNTED